jgi:hypothetical protein
VALGGVRYPRAVGRFRIAVEAAGVKILQPLEDLPAGQRHFICQAPGGVMVDVIEEIPPSPEFAEQYLS